MELYDPSVALTAQDEVGPPRPANIHLEDIPQSREKLHAATGELAPTGPKKWYPSWPIPTPIVNLRVPAASLSPSPPLKKKADVAEHTGAFRHVGLLVNEPPGPARLPLV